METQLPSAVRGTFRELFQELFRGILRVTAGACPCGAQSLRQSEKVLAYIQPNEAAPQSSGPGTGCSTGLHTSAAGIGRTLRIG